MPRNLIHSNALVDYRGVIASPGAILREGNRIIAVGSPQEVGGNDECSLTQVNGVVTPSFVNAHAHLDLSGVGTVSAKESFVQWVEDVVLPIRREPEAIDQHVRAGIELVIAGGSQIVGDIAGSLRAAELTAELLLYPRSYVELLGLGQRQQLAVEQLQAVPLQFGLSPHAPYSCGRDVYAACFESGRPVSTHLAESLEEIDSVQHCKGALVNHAKNVGSWDDSVEAWNEHPIDAVLDVAGCQPFVAAHLNYVENHHMDKLSTSNITVAYCPRASQYFGHSNHRWQEMIERGINVALGTDSLLCLDTPDRISVIDEMRLLHARDQADPELLLKIGTVNGAIGLGFDPNLVTLTVGETAGLLAFDTAGNDPLNEIFNSSSMPTWL